MKRSTFDRHIVTILLSSLCWTGLGWNTVSAQTPAPATSTTQEQDAPLTPAGRADLAAAPGPAASTPQAAAQPGQTTPVAVGKLEQPAALTSPLRTFALPPRIGIRNETSITLSDALYMALTNNPDIQASRDDREESAYKHRAAQGAYDPVFNATGSFQKQLLPVGNTLSGGGSDYTLLNRTWQVTPSVSGFSPLFGTSYNVAFSNQKFYTNNAYSALNPSYPATLTFEFTQPLLRNLFYDTARHTIEVSQKNQAVTSETFRQRVMAVIQRTEQAYWELSFAKRDLGVQLQALDVARTQDETNRRQVSLGQLAPIEVVAAQTQLATFEYNVYAAQENLTRAENGLKSLILGDRSDALWTSAINPTTPPETENAMPALDDAVKEALALRPEVAQLKLAGQINQADQRLNREQLKPQVDLVASYARSALAGTAVASAANPLANSLQPALARLNQLSALAGLDPVTLASTAPAPPSQLVGGYGTALGGLFGTGYPTSFVELRVSLPITNRTAKANLSASLVEGRRLDHQMHALEQAIEADVRNALQCIDSAEQRLSAARLKQESAEEEYQSEQRRFGRGASTLFLVQQRQLNMVTSRSQVYRAEADLNEAVSLFELAHGENYKRHNIVLK